MDVNTKIFLKKKFQDYYWKNKVPAPREVDKREFGVGNLEKKILIRHKSFPLENDLQNYLKHEAPFYISYSTACYEFPTNEPMSAKNWLYADLVFDLDMPMELFNAEKFQLVKNEAINLRDFLLNDFGFSQQDLSINFSGSKGYHIHVFSEKAKNLGSGERGEIVDFMTGNINFKEFWYSDGSTILGPKKDDKGWKGKIWQKLYSFVKEANKTELISTPGIGGKKAEFILENKLKILKELEDGIYTSIANAAIITFDMADRTRRTTGDPNVRVRIIKDIRSKVLQKIIDSIAVKAIASKDADKMVTIDTSRLIRLPDTLHGGSGLLAKKVSDIDKFNPLEHATAFGNELVKIKLEKKIPEFDFGNGKVGPFDIGIQKVPESLAVYLLLKGSGDFLQ